MNEDPPNQPIDGKGWLIGAGIVLGIIGLGLWTCAATAIAHEATATNGQPLGWNYPISCCSLQDCRPAKAGEIRETLEGYKLMSTGEVVGYQDKRVKESPSGDFHVCQQGGNFDTGRVLCLFAPGRGY